MAQSDRAEDGALREAVASALFAEIRRQGPSVLCKEAADAILTALADAGYEVVKRTPADKTSR